MRSSVSSRTVEPRIQEIIAGMLDLPSSKWRNRKQQEFATLKTKCDAMNAAWEPYDWAKKLIEIARAVAFWRCDKTVTAVGSNEKQRRGQCASAGGRECSLVNSEDKTSLTQLEMVENNNNRMFC
ncbi:hypothetical protein ANCCEY_03440 [Ancylostoma ceylanicum]|uniref:Cwf19-like protein C-terminal domain-containing protein n=1 Tax=Ancylostoma ceylanicum TaxID=53326 RepID=A0A0D6MB67_9BILA|nr:hypothetical protein ANCCEY_03440 [Ancylostoma ceylanicum]